LSCYVCAAPALPLEGACVFCHAPLTGADQPLELLDYLTDRIPTAKIKRGAWNRGPITDLVVEVGNRSFRARWRKDELEVEPPVDLKAWIDLLLTHLSDAATGDADLRRAVLRSGWALR